MRERNARAWFQAATRTRGAGLVGPPCIHHLRHPCQNAHVQQHTDSGLGTGDRLYSRVTGRAELRPPTPATGRPAALNTYYLTADPVLLAIGDFLNGYPWAHYLTLTFRPPQTHKKATDPALVANGQPWGRYTRRITSAAPVSQEYALRQWAAFRGRLAREIRVPMFWFYGVEHGEKFGRLHLHALTGNTERLPVYVMRELWRSGWSHVKPYDPRKGASYYITKYVTKELAEWDISGDVEQARRMARHREPSRKEAERLSVMALARMRAYERARQQVAGTEQQETLLPE